MMKRCGKMWFCLLALGGTMAGISSFGASNEFKRPYVAPKEMVSGGQFIDRFLPLVPSGPLIYETWGGDNVVPRDVLNGMENMEHSYWGGNIVKGDDGLFHMFVCRWREDNTRGKRSGHMTWGSSEVVHAVADKAVGPYEVREVIGGGHNPEVYRRKDGSYILGVMGYNAYKATSLDGPWVKFKPTFQWLVCEHSQENRTYAIREDGAALMMAKDGKMHISEHADENFIQVTENNAMRGYAHSIMEDPVIWRDEVQYNCIYNDAIGRTAFYMRSQDGIHWKWMEGVAYNPRVVTRPDGSYEDWYKMERPKVLCDEYGRATHMNFAAMDGAKWDDKANDKHSSKNLVMPLRVPRRMQILNEERLTRNTKEITLKILREEGFYPVTDLDMESLRLGAPEIVNMGGGCVVTRSKNVSDGLIITFSGEGNGFENHNFAAKLIGRDKAGELIFGYAKMKPSQDALVDEIVSHTIPEDISIAGKIKFAVIHKTKEERLLQVDLIHRATGEIIKGTGTRSINGEGVSVINYASNAPLDLESEYMLRLSMSTVDDQQMKLSNVIEHDLLTVPLDAPQDRIVAHTFPAEIPDRGRIMFTVNYEAKTKRDLRVECFETSPVRALKSSVVKPVKGKGQASLVLALDPDDGITAGKEYLIYIYLARTGGAKDQRISNRIGLWGRPAITAGEFKMRYQN